MKDLQSPEQRSDGKGLPGANHPLQPMGMKKTKAEKIISSEERRANNSGSRSNDSRPAADLDDVKIDGAHKRATAASSPDCSNGEVVFDDIDSSLNESPLNKAKVGVIDVNLDNVLPSDCEDGCDGMMDTMDKTGNETKSKTYGSALFT